MAEWSKAADCKSVSNSHVGSNPTLLNIVQQYNKLTLTFKLFQKKNLRKYIISYNSFTKLKKFFIQNYLNFLKIFTFKKIRNLGFYFNFNNTYIKNYILVLNFKRLRFFPLLKTLSNQIFISLSLGLLSKFFQKGKFFLKSKIVYLTLLLFLRKILIFSSFKKFLLFINKKPKYLSEMLNTLTTPSVAQYKHPFSDNIITERELNNPFVFSHIIFTNNKPYGIVKRKQKGRLKRKIFKKIIQLNKILD
jgi:hypothetical protein